MLRLTILLCSGLFLVLLLGGRDVGQLRPGLALAEAEANVSSVTAEVPDVETMALANDTAQSSVAVAEVVEAPATRLAPVATQAQVVPVAQVADVAPVPSEPENTVFTLSNYADPVAEAVAAVEPVAQDEIWYVAGNSLNVRAGPSTDDAVVGKLSRGEAMLVVARAGEDWAQIRIEGDGIEGFVAMRFLTPELPMVN